MQAFSQKLLITLVLAGGAGMGASSAADAQTAQRDGIGDLLNRNGKAQVAQAQPKAGAPEATKEKPGEATATADPREGDPAYEQAQRLMKAIDAILQDTARNRGEARKLPPESDFLMKPLWTETREDREKKIRDLLDAALGVITDVPVVEVQKQDREPAQEHPRSRRPHRQAAREAAHGAQGCHAAGSTDRHRGQPRQGRRGNQEAGSRPTRLKSPQPRRRSTLRSPRAASSLRPSRSTCCSTACCRATWCASWRCSIPPS